MFLNCIVANKHNFHDIKWITHSRKLNQKSMINLNKNCFKSSWENFASYILRKSQPIDIYEVKLKPPTVKPGIIVTCVLTNLSTEKKTNSAILWTGSTRTCGTLNMLTTSSEVRMLDVLHRRLLLVPLQRCHLLDAAAVAPAGCCSSGICSLLQQ